MDAGGATAGVDEQRCGATRDQTASMSVEIETDAGDFIGSKFRKPMTGGELEIYTDWEFSGAIHLLGGTGGCGKVLDVGMAGDLFREKVICEIGRASCRERV